MCKSNYVLPHDISINMTAHLFTGRAPAKNTSPISCCLPPPPSPQNVGFIDNECGGQWLCLLSWFLCSCQELSATRGFSPATRGFSPGRPPVCSFPPRWRRNNCLQLPRNKASLVAHKRLQRNNGS